MKRLKTTTALVAGLTALVPSLAPAQSLVGADLDACIQTQINGGSSEDAARAACEGGNTPAAEATEQTEAGVTTEAEATAPEPTAEAPVIAPEAEAQVDGATSITMPQAPLTISPTTDAAPEAEEAPAAEAPAAEAAPEAPTETAAPAQDPAADTEVQATGETAAETEAGTPAPTDPDALQKMLTEQTAPTPAEPAPTTEADPTVTTTTEAPAPAEVEAEASATAETTATAETPAATAEKTEAVQQLEEAIAASETADSGAPVSNAALAAETDAAAEADAPVTEEVITEETARSSAEDFQSAINATTQAVTATKDKKDGKGLTTLEKAAVLGLGALAVGAILKNGSEVAVNSGDRVVVQNPDGSYRVIKDDNALLRQPGTTLSTQNYADGSTRTISTKADGTQIITVYDAQRRIIQRTRIDPDGQRYVLVDDSIGADPVEITTLPRAQVTAESTDTEALRAALARETAIDRRFSLAQVRQIAQVRALAPAVAVENITFATGSAAIRPEQARALAKLGDTIRARIAENPREIFLIEGHTDAVGDAAYNLALSDRRAESLALALTEYFGVPPENLVVQGYGEEFLKVDTQRGEEANRRVSVRRITDLLQVASAN
jgi:outer membrane protein OmpA-like peptidoglycan-associated protein